MAVFLALVAPSGALATDSGPAGGDGAEGVAAEPRVQISKRDCRRLMARHRARGDVAYKPEAEIRGRKFLPADVGGSFRMPLPDVFAPRT